MVDEQEYNDGIRCKGICSICRERNCCYQGLSSSVCITNGKTKANYPTVDKVYLLDNNLMIGVDQSDGDDKTCLCFTRLKRGKFHVERFEFIEKQKDMDEYININTGRWV